MMPELSLNILDVAENSFRAGATHVEIFIDEQEKEGTISITITDNGKGMDTESLKAAVDPFFSTKKNKGWGLGIPFFKQTADLCKGSFKIESTENEGTITKIVLPLSHIDRPPLGNISDTIVTLAAGHVNSDITLIMSRDNKQYEFKTEIIREETDNMSLNDPDILLFIENDINIGIRNIGLED